MGKVQPKLPNRWLVFAAALLGSICIAASQFKVNGTLSFIVSDYGIDVTTGGLLNTISALANILVALPGGLIVNKFGVRKVWLIAIAVCCCANVLGYFAADYTLLLLTRFFEGLSVGFVLIVSPVIITQVFSAEKRGLPMMLWSLWTILGTLIILNLDNVFTPAFGWRSNWLVAAALLAVAFAFNFAVCKVAGDRDKATAKAASRQGTARVAKGRSVWGECFKNPVLIGICVVMLGGVFANSLYLSYYPLFLQNTLGVSSAMANSVSTVHTYWSIFLCLTFGFVLNKVANKHHPKIFFVLPFLSLAGGTLMWNMPTIPLDIMAILLCVTGQQLTGPMAHNLVPDAVAPRAVPIGMGMLSFVTGISQMLSPLIAGRVVDLTGNWHLVAVPVAVFTLSGLVGAIVVLKKMYKNKDAERAVKSAK